MNLHDSRRMPLNAVIVVDKPAGWTSHDVVAKARHILGERSIGHLGTLDPMATGVLPLVVGRMTRLCQFYSASEKAYEGTIRFGFATNTYDADGDSAGPPQEVNVTLEEIIDGAKTFVGSIKQVPPSFSAKKINGVPAYKMARRQQEVELQPVDVEVKEFVTGSMRAILSNSVAACPRVPTFAASPTSWGRSLESGRIWPACDVRRWLSLIWNRATPWSRSPRPWFRID
jgi:tRNA pseudouridine(55) synthase